MSTIADVLANTHAWHVEQGDCLSVLRTLPGDCVHCCVCSPPYFALRSYLGKDNPAKSLELGLEPLHDCLGWASGTPCGSCYVCHLVAVFREVCRVLHPSGTLFLVLGDSFGGDKIGNTNGGASSGLMRDGRSESSRLRTNAALGAEMGRQHFRKNVGRAKQLLGISWRVALALQADGWHLRSAITWAKSAPMPESTRDRPTRATEQIFLLTKSSRYSYDQEAERVPEKDAASRNKEELLGNMAPGVQVSGAGGRNLWDYWEIPDEEPQPLLYRLREGVLPEQVPPEVLDCLEPIITDTEVLSDFWKLGPQPSKVRHFGKYPKEIPRRCIRLGTSEKGCCPHCLAPWRRVIQRQRTHNGVPRDDLGAWRNTDPGSPSGAQGDGHWRYASVTRTVGWEPCCDCPPHQPIPCLVLDPFSGSGTTGLVARRLGRRYLGIELNAKDVVTSERRIRQDNPLFHDVE